MKNKATIFLSITILVAATVTTFILYKKLGKIDAVVNSVNQKTLLNLGQNQNAESYFDEMSNSITKAPYTRAEFIADIQKNTGLQLEIGPYFTPVLRGPNVRYFDVLDQKELIKKAKIDDVLIDNIPNIHYVEPYGNMSIIKEKFDIIFSSHNIEHQVSLVTHLQQIESLLKKDGKFYLAAPDKRYCFDHFVSLTPLSMVLATYWEPSQNHSLQTILAKCETGHNDSKKHWEGNSEVPLFMKQKDCFKEEYQNYKNANANYIDAHKWRLTPQSFASIVNELNRMKLISLKVEKIWDTAVNSHEFYAILVKE